MRKILSVFLLMSLILTCGHSFAYSEKDVERLKMYALVLGRAGACGDFMEQEILKVAAWMESVFKSRSQEHLEVFFRNMSRMQPCRKHDKPPVVLSDAQPGQARGTWQERRLCIYYESPDGTTRLASIMAVSGLFYSRRDIAPTRTLSQEAFLPSLVQTFS